MTGLKKTVGSFDAPWIAVGDEFCVVDPECCNTYVYGGCNSRVMLVPNFLYPTFSGIPADCGGASDPKFVVKNQTYKFERTVATDPVFAGDPHLPCFLGGPPTYPYKLIGMSLISTDLPTCENSPSYQGPFYGMHVYSYIFTPFGSCVVPVHVYLYATACLQCVDGLDYAQLTFRFAPIVIAHYPPTEECNGVLTPIPDPCGAGIGDYPSVTPGGVLWPLFGGSSPWPSATPLDLEVDVVLPCSPDATVHCHVSD